MRIKRGVTKNQKHKKVLKAAKGYRMSYSRLYRRALEATMHAGAYSTIHRKHRRAQKRQEWIKIIAAALSSHNVSYNQFINNLKVKNVIVDRKNMAKMASEFPAEFNTLVAFVK